MSETQKYASADQPKPLDRQGGVLYSEQLEGHGLRALWLCCWLLLVALTPAAEAASNCVINLSHYDVGTPDFARMKREGVEAVIHEATYPPGDTDPQYASRQDSAVRHGLQWGAYHFGNATDPVRQADHFVDFVIRESRRNGGNRVLMILDFETNTHYPGGTMSVEQAVRFIRRVYARTGKYPGIYSNENRVRSVLSNPSLPSETRKTLGECWLWIANYHYEPASHQPWGRWTMWQYTGDGKCDLPRGSHPIHAGNLRNVERNFYRGSLAEMIDFWAEHAWRP